ncbi:hypothetical protein PHMEG_0004234 [Phytophthora megakarya]|uniref:Uncharacterized protein n=1 Tax=Phytophthora megakarya TaxID=4795 RepID=A0A225WU73_9STRA|nr:hypothetical protein PHMEG_0004234 [Phytophthora megakarya]
MGAKPSKPLQHRNEAEESGVEVFHEPAPQDTISTKRAATQGSVHVVRSHSNEQPPQANGSETTESQTKEKKKRRRSKKEKNKVPSPKLVRAQTQLNELKNVKPMLQSQQHYGGDEEAKKAPPPDAKARLFGLEHWRKVPVTTSDKDDSPTTHSPPPLTHSQVRSDIIFDTFVASYTYLICCSLVVKSSTSVVWIG